MSNEAQQKVHGIVDTMDLPESLSQAEVEQVILEYVTPASDSREDIKLRLDPETGEPSGGESVKTSNLKFRFGDFMMELIKSGGKLYATKALPILWVPVIVDFGKRAKALSTLEFGNKEAQILMALYQLKLEGDSLTIGSLYSLIDEKLSEQDIQKILQGLENMGCLTLETGRIVLNEALDI